MFLKLTRFLNFESCKNNTQRAKGECFDPLEHFSPQEITQKALTVSTNVWKLDALWTLIIKSMSLALADRELIWHESAFSSFSFVGCTLHFDRFSTLLLLLMKTERHSMRVAFGCVLFHFTSFFIIYSVFLLFSRTDDANICSRGLRCDAKVDDFIYFSFPILLRRDSHPFFCFSFPFLFVLLLSVFIFLAILFRPC